MKTTLLLSLVLVGLWTGACDDSGGRVDRLDVQDRDLPSDLADTLGDTAGTEVDVGLDSSTPDIPDDETTPLLGPPDPIVLAHGMGGFEYLAGIEGISYFYGVRERLEAEGEVVFVTAVDPLNTTEVRGQQLADGIATYLQESHYAKVNLIGHSQGGLDARWVAHHYPKLVSSVVTYATPNHGSKLADVVLGIVADDRVQDAIDALVNIFGVALYDELGAESSFFAPLRLFSQDGIAAFNQEITDAPDVAYYSVAGRSGNHGGGLDCLEVDRPQFILDWQFVVDPVDLLLAVPEAILRGPSLLDPIPNDGMVRVADAKWGRFLGCVPADHMDEVGQLLGDAPGTSNDWDHVQFFVDLVGFLRAEGH